MKRFITAILAVLLYIPVLFSQDYFNRNENQHRHHLIILHPTLSNMERYSYLISEGILDPGKNLIVGVYFEAEAYDYEPVIKAFPRIGFHAIPGKIEPDDIFRENVATPEFRKIFDYSEGIIFNGGPDIPPIVYGEEMSTLTSVTDPFRHFFETSFLVHLLGSTTPGTPEPFLKKRPRYSILAICLGMQTMNVALGGSLIQDIPSEIYGQGTVEQIVSEDLDLQHRNYYSDLQLYPEIRSYSLHRIKLVPGRWLENEVKYRGNNTPYVFTSHHQAVGELANDLRVTATSMDGKIVEALEHTRYPNVVGIQFHPEADVLYQDKKEFKFKPSDEPFSLKEELENHESLDFHLQLWKAFSRSL